MIRRITLFYLSGLMSMLPAATQANVLITGTRVIYPQEQREVSVQLNNDSPLPALVQAWIDKGDPEQDLSKISVPFILLPPIFRMEPHTGQTLRLAWSGESLAADRESLFWLNVLDIPPKNPALSNGNTLQMAIRTRIKIFFRPTGLTAEGADTAARQLHWQHPPAAAGNVLRLVNPTPYFINLAQMEIRQAGRTIHSVAGEMLPPKGSATLRFNQPVNALHHPGIDYHVVNDYGSTMLIRVKPDSAVQ